MTYAARVICDSISPDGARLLTIEATYWRAIHPQMLHHRDFSRGASSNRAQPTLSVLERTVENPTMPIFWGKKAKGMQAVKQLLPSDIALAQEIWLEAMWDMARHIRRLDDLGLHKQLANRLMEPWQDITVLYTGTRWDNFFSLRCHKDAQPEERHIANLIKMAVEQSTPIEREWHLPFVSDEELNSRTLEDLIKLSVARCARISYLNHDGVYAPEKDLELYDRLALSVPPHRGPFEHVANAALYRDQPFYNLDGWTSWRWFQDNDLAYTLPLSSRLDALQVA